jgi:NitT/TauT family transport system substrate-binding protein
VSLAAHLKTPALLGTVLLLASCAMPGANVRQPTPSPMPRTLKLRVAFTSVAEFGDVPLLMAHDLLANEGYEVAPTFYAQGELAVEALTRGDAEIGAGSTRTFWAAVANNAHIRTIMEQVANEWQIVAMPGINTCADLHGRRFGIHSEGSVGEAMTRAYLQEKCPGTERQILVIPGSDNRAAALLAGQIDATALDLASAVQVNIKAPGRFRTLTSFAQDLPGLKTTCIYVNTDFAAAHPDAVRDYVRAVLTVHRQINKDHDLLTAAVRTKLEAKVEDALQIATAYFAINGWNVNGGLNEEAVRYSLDFFVKSGSLPPKLRAQDVADLSYLNPVLDELGRR